MGSTLAAIIAIGVLIVIHEAGHFLVARWSRMRVPKFSIGFGPALAKVKRGDTEFQVGMLPLGGFVQIEGMNPHDGSDPNSPSSYNNRPAHLRFATIFAGPAANYLLGFVLLFAFYAFFAAESLAPVRVVRVVEGSAAERAGLKKDDLIVGTASAAFDLAEELRETIQAAGKKGVTLQIDRHGDKSILELVPDEVAGGFQIGIELEGTDRRIHALGVVDGAKAAVLHVGNSSKLLLTSLAALFRPGGGAQLSGPIGMVQSLSRRVDVSWAEALAFLADISIMLGIMNLLPIPALDGSRLLFLVLGLIRRKPISPRIEAYVHVAGFILLIGLLIVISIGDVTR
jgi:regulator of sigma E protease